MASPLKFEENSRTLSIAGQSFALTKAEYDLVSYLAARRPSVVTRAELSQAVLHMHSHATSKALEMLVSRARRRLGADGSLIETVPGCGYRLRMAR